MTKVEAMTHAKNLKILAKRNIIKACALAFVAGTILGEAINAYARYTVFNDREEVMRNVAENLKDD